MNRTIALAWLAGTVLSLACLSSDPCIAESSPEAERLFLRNQTARDYFSAEPHLRLARFHYLRDDRMQAFYIVEHTRTIVDDDQFNRVFQSVAANPLEPSPSPSEVLESPGVARLADGSDGDVQKVDEALSLMMAAFPKAIGPKAVAARFYLEARNDLLRALPLYLDLYFHDPHYYDGEFAEHRIRTISLRNKQRWWHEARQARLPLAEVVARERNPRVLDVLIEEARESWEPALVSILLTLFEYDDAYLQSASLHVLLDHCDDVVRRVDVRGMLASTDLVKRAMASLLAVKCLGVDHFDLLRDNLKSGIDLVQLDAVMALDRLGGDAGRTYLRTNRPEPLSPGLREILNKLLSDETGTTSRHEADYDVEAVRVGQFAFEPSPSASIGDFFEGSGFRIPSQYPKLSFILSSSSRFRAQIGSSFGFSYRVRGLPAGQVKTFEMRAVHPPIATADGRTMTISTAPAVIVGEGDECPSTCNTSHIVYTLREAAQVVPGKWELQLVDRGRVVISREFHLE